MLNSLIAWNQSTASPHNSRKTMKRYEFYTYIAERLLNFRDSSPLPMDGSASVANESVFTVEEGSSRGNHVPVSGAKRDRCLVCRLELGMNNSLGQKGLTTDVVQCKACGIMAHGTVLLDSNRFIHTIPEFKQLTCFEIFHSKAAKGIWKMNPEGSKYKTCVCATHPIVKSLRVMHGKSEIIQRKRKQQPSGNDEEDEDDDGRSQTPPTLFTDN